MGCLILIVGVFGPPVAWAVLSLVQISSSGCPYGTWLLLNAVVCVLLVWFVVNIAVKANTGPTECKDDADAESSSMAKAGKREATLPTSAARPEVMVSHDYKIHTAQDKPLVESQKSTMDCAESTPIKPVLKDEDRAAQHRPNNIGLSPVAMTPANSYSRIAHVFAYGTSGVYYLMVFEIYFLWPIRVLCDFIDVYVKDNRTADWNQVMCLTLAAAALGCGYLALFAIANVCTK